MQVSPTQISPDGTLDLPLPHQLRRVPSRHPAFSHLASATEHRGIRPEHYLFSRRIVREGHSASPPSSSIRTRVSRPRDPACNKEVVGAWTIGALRVAIAMNSAPSYGRNRNSNSFNPSYCAHRWQNPLREGLAHHGVAAATSPTAANQGAVAPHALEVPPPWSSHCSCGEHRKRRQSFHILVRAEVNDSQGRPAA